jgi:GNAT superfamily N-acetyltransferase
VSRKPNRTPLERFTVTVTYLEQRARPRTPSPPHPSGKLALMRVTEPPIHFYRYLFDAVGRPHKWVSRRYLTDDELRPLIHTETAQIFVLYRDGWIAGYTELDLSEGPNVVIKFFGLVPEAQGLGLGRWFLHETLTLAWDHNPERVRIETCTADSPNALRLYQRMGFEVYDQGTGLIEWYG